MYWKVLADWWVGTTVCIGKCRPTGRLVLLYVLENVGQLVGRYTVCIGKCQPTGRLVLLYLLESVGRLVGRYTVCIGKCRLTGG